MTEQTDKPAEPSGPIYWENASDFEEHFDPSEYTSTFYIVDYHKPLLNNLHAFFSKAPIKSGRLLDVGSGPCIHTVISASKIFTDIYLSDVSSRNRHALQKWKNKDTGAFDWTPYLEHVATLEGTELDLIESRLRGRIYDVLPCDVLAENIIPDSVGKFDCITTSACLEGACLTKESHRAALRRLGDLLVPGGYLVVVTYLNDTSYTFGGKTFGAICLSKEDVIDALRSAGFKEIETNIALDKEEVKAVYWETSSTDDLLLAIARKAH